MDISENLYHIVLCFGFIQYENSTLILTCRMLERVTSWTWHSTEIGTIIEGNLLEVYSCGWYTVSRIWNDLGIV